MFVAQRFVLMFPWAHFRMTACSDDDSDEETQRGSVVCAATRPEDRTDDSKTQVLVWRGDAILGGGWTEFADDLTDVEECTGDLKPVGDIDGEDGDAAASGAEPPAKKLKAKECDDHAPEVEGALQNVDK